VLLLVSPAPYVFTLLRARAASVPQESESDVTLRVERMIAQGKAHPDDRFFYRFVGPLNTPVVGPVMGLFGGRRDSLFANPFK
jgi:hypothetical protein